MYPPVYRNGVSSGVRKGFVRGGAVTEGTVLQSLAQTERGKEGLEACQSACAREQGCAYWSWRPHFTNGSGTGTPTCTLYSSVWSTAPDPDHLSGRRGAEFINQP